MRLYNNECIFYLEKRRVDEKNPMIGYGPYLKYGPKRKTLTNCLDLGQSGGKIVLVRTPGSRTKFKVIAPDNTKLRLKASTSEERDEWIRIITKEVKEASL